MSRGNTLYFKVYISDEDYDLDGVDANIGGLGVDDSIIKALTDNTDTIIFSSDRSTAGVAKYGYGTKMKAEPTIDYTEDGEADNNGAKGSKVAFSLIAVGLDKITDNVMAEKLKALNGQNLFVYFIDTVAGLVVKGGKMRINTDIKTTGNLKEEWTVKGEETGDDIYYRKVLPLTI